MYVRKSKSEVILLAQDSSGLKNKKKSMTELVKYITFYVRDIDYQNV